MNKNILTQVAYIDIAYIDIPSLECVSDFVDTYNEERMSFDITYTLRASVADSDDQELIISNSKEFSQALQVKYPKIQGDISLAEFLIIYNK